MSLASNAQVAQVFQAIVFVLHSHHPLRSVLGRDLAKALASYMARAQYRLTRVATCDSLHVTNLL